MSMTVAAEVVCFVRPRLLRACLEASEGWRHAGEGTDLVRLGVDENGADLSTLRRCKYYQRIKKLQRAKACSTSFSMSGIQSDSHDSQLALRR